MYGSAGFSSFRRRPARLAVQPLRRAEQREVRPQQQDLQAAPLRREPDVRAARSFSERGTVTREERVAPVGPGRREDRVPRAAEQRPDLRLGPPHRRRRGDDLRPDRLAVHDRASHSASIAVS